MRSQRQSRLLSVKKDVAYRLFYPEVPAVLCCASGELVAAMPVNSCFPLSHDPSLVGVSVQIRSKTDRVLHKSSFFSINWLSNVSSSRKAIIKLSSIAPKSNDKLAACGIDYRLVKGAPVLRASVAFLVCKKISVMRFGDHDLFVGEVKVAKAPDDFAGDEYWRFRKYRPILYLGRNRPNPFTTI